MYKHLNTKKRHKSYKRHKIYSSKSMFSTCFSKVLLSCHFIAKELLNQLDYFKLG